MACSVCLDRVERLTLGSGGRGLLGGGPGQGGSGNFGMLFGRNSACQTSSFLILIVDDGFGSVAGANAVLAPKRQTVTIRESNF